MEMDSIKDEDDNNIVINMMNDSTQVSDKIKSMETSPSGEMPLTTVLPISFTTKCKTIIKNHYSLINTLKKMRKYRWLHKTCAEYYERWNSIIITPTILLSAATSILSVASIDPLVLAIISSLGTTLLGISTYLKLNSKHMNHLIAAEGYDNIITMVDFELNFPNENIKEFAASIEKKILEIKKTTHFLPPEFIYNKYLKRKTIIEGIS